MKNRRLALFCIYYLLVVSCSKDEPIPSDNDYPVAIGKIIASKCATTGCHNNKSKDGAAGLSLESWDALFEGNGSGLPVIPFSTEHSTLLFYINTYSDLGIQLAPTMPIGKAPLSREEVTLLKEWIASGAPNRDGLIKFSNNAERKKIYIANQGCDVVTIFDAATGNPMRYINVGKSSAIESPHMIKVSPDGNYWYVIFLASDAVQKYRTSDDTYVGEINIGNGNWNTFSITSDSKKAFCIDWSSTGKIAYINLETMSLISIWTGLFSFPHGSAINPTNDTLYVTAQTGNFIYKIPVNDPGSSEEISLQTGVAASTNPAQALDPHEIAFSPNGNFYYVTCQKTNEVRVMQRSNDALIAIIPTGIFPQEMSFSTSQPYLFVTCPEDTAAFSGKRGLVSIVNYTTNTFIKNIHTGFQPHGIAVNDGTQLIYVANRNNNPNGPAPHHVGVCGGRNGYMTAIDLNTLSLKPNWKIEVSVDPYSVSVRK